MSNEPLRGEDFWRTDPGPRADVSAPAETDVGESQRDGSSPTPATTWESEPSDTSWPDTTEATDTAWPPATETPDSTWPPTEPTAPASDDETPPRLERRRTNPLLWIAVAALVIGLPVIVGLVAFLQSPGPSAEAAESEPVAAPAAPAPAPDLDRLALTRPTWTRPAWANAVSGATVYELQSSTDVPFATGRMRPRLGMRCIDGSLEVHVVTGGTAHIDPETSRHVVLIGFDGAERQPERWVGAADQQALFAPDPEAFIARIARSEELEIAYTHYMAGPIPVSFNLTGADEIVESVARACG